MTEMSVLTELGHVGCAPINMLFNQQIDSRYQENNTCGVATMTLKFQVICVQFQVILGHFVKFQVFQVQSQILGYFRFFRSAGRPDSCCFGCLHVCATGIICVKEQIFFFSYIENPVYNKRRFPMQAESCCISVDLHLSYIA